MIPSQFRVVLDANVLLFPFTVRDTLLRAATLGLYQVYWSEQILNEATRNLIATGRMTEEQASHLVAMMHDAFPEALVRGHEDLIPSMPNDHKDRHVAAVAVAVAVEVIVTLNLNEFTLLLSGAEAQSPDEFLLNLLDLAPGTVLELLRSQAAALRKPPATFDNLLVGLGRTVPRFAKTVRRLVDSNVQT